MTPFEKIYDRVLPKFEDYDIPQMSDDETSDVLHDYLLTAIPKFHVCRKDLSKINADGKGFEEDLIDMEIEILSNYLLLEYLDSKYIRTPLLLKVSLSSSDFNAYSPANMLDKLMSMHKKYLHENEALLSRYAWIGLRKEGKDYQLGNKLKPRF